MVFVFNDHVDRLATRILTASDLLKTYKQVDNINCDTFVMEVFTDIYKLIHHFASNKLYQTQQCK